MDIGLLAWSRQMRWTLSIAEAEQLESIVRPLNGDGCVMSGDDRPRAAVL